MTLGSRRFVVAIGARTNRMDLERSAGIALTFLLHAGLLMFFLWTSVRPAIKPQRVQAANVIDMQLIPQVEVRPTVTSPSKPVVHPKPKPRLKPKPIVLKPKVPEPQQALQVPSPPVVESVPASTVPPAPTASAGIIEPLPLAYLTRVMMTIGLNRRYPLKALANREQGIAVVHIHLARDGSVLDVEVIRSSGHQALDDEARDVVLRIGSFQALPPEYARGAEDFFIDQPIRFTGY